MSDYKSADGVKIGNITVRHIARTVPSEQVPKKFETVPERPSPDSKEEELLKMLDDRLGKAKEAKMKKHDIWNYAYLQYRSVNYYSMLYGAFPTYWNQWGMGVFVPRTFETIEATKTQMMQREPDFSIEPTFPNESAYAQNMNFLEHAEWKRAKMNREVAETVHDALVYGAGIVQPELIDKKEVEQTLTWKEEIVTDEATGAQTKKYSIAYVPKNVQKYYGVGGHRVDPYDLFPDPSPEYNRMSQIGYCFERFVVDAWELREQYKALKESGAHGVTDNWQYLKPGGDTTDYKYIRREIDGLYQVGDNARYPANINDFVVNRSTAPTSQQTAHNELKVEMWVYWEKDRMIVFANGLILRDSPNPYPHKQIPYVKYNAIDMNDFWSIGIPEYIRWLQITENILYDQGLNNIVMSIHKMFAVNSRYLEDEGELVVRPFGIIHMKNIPNVKVQDAIMPIEYTNNMNNYFNFIRMNTQNIQTVTGVSPYQTGGITKESKVERATVANKLAFAGASRIREIARHLEVDMVSEIVEQHIGIIQFYYQRSEALEGGLAIEVPNPQDSYFIKFVPKNMDEVTEEDRNLARNEGYRDIIGQDRIQGRFRVVVRAGSTTPIDPEQKAELKLKFAEFAKGAVVSEKITGVDQLTGKPTEQVLTRPVFDVEMIAKELAKEVFEIANPNDYLYKPKNEAPAQPGSGGAPMPMSPMNPVAGEMPASPEGANVVQ